MTSVLHSVDRLSNDSKENNVSSHLKQEAATEFNLKDETSTSFNPFGKYKTLVSSNRANFNLSIENLIKSSKQESIESSSTFFKRRPEANQLLLEIKRISNSIRTMAKNLPTAIPSTLTIIIPSLLKLCQFLDNCSSLKNVRSGEVVLISQAINELIENVAQNCPEPYGSNLLEEWCELFEVMLKSNVVLLKNGAINLWSKTFGKVQGKLCYPNNTLRPLLLSLPKKHNLSVPANENCSPVKNDQQKFDCDDDEQAMDGIESSSKSINLVKNETSFQESLTFDLSQQPNFDKLASKLIEEKGKKGIIDKKQKADQISSEIVDKKVIKMEKSHQKLTKPEKLLVDEDTNDFVVITTPQSNKKVLLTDHQKEKFNEIRDQLQYVNEESQSSTQKEIALKTALTNFNLKMEEEEEEEKGKESVLIKKEIDDADEEKSTILKEDEVLPSKRASLKRSRRLFSSDEKPKKCRARSQKLRIDDEQESGLDEDDDSTLLELPPLIRENTEDDAQKINISASEDNEKFDTEIAISGRSRTKKQTNPKKIVIDDGERTPKRMSERISLKKVDAQEAEPQTTFEPSTPTTNHNPKKAMTPSILRKSTAPKTPSTEQRRNRVHFDAEPAEQQPPTAVVALADRIEKKVSTSSPSKMRPVSPCEKRDEAAVISNSCLPNIDYNPEVEVLYPSLTTCPESIDVLAWRLAPLSVSAVSILKKSLSMAGVKTIGQFAALSIGRLNKLNGIRAPKEKVARKILSEYEANSRKLAKFVGLVGNEVVEVEEKEEEVKNGEKKTKEEIVEAKESTKDEKDSDHESIQSNETEPMEIEAEVATTPPESSENENQILKDVKELNETSRRICRLIGKSDISKESWDQIDDDIFDTFVRIRGLVRERGFKNI